MAAGGQSGKIAGGIFCRRGVKTLTAYDTYVLCVCLQVSHVKEAVAMEDMSQFQTRCEELANGSVDTIFTDQVVYGVVSR